MTPFSSRSAHCPEFVSPVTRLTWMVGRVILSYIFGLHCIRDIILHVVFIRHDHNDKCSWAYPSDASGTRGVIGSAEQRLHFIVKYSLESLSNIRYKEPHICLGQLWARKILWDLLRMSSNCDSRA